MWLFINSGMRKVLHITPNPKDNDLFRALERAGVDLKRVKYNKIDINTKDEVLVEKVLRIHGYETEEPRALDGAIGLLSEKYLGEFVDESRLEAQKEAKATRRRLMKFINNKTHKARRLRARSRRQHVRDNLEGQVTAYEEVLRYLRKR
jgi:glycine cleavage system aminomethyltransferase T